MSQHDQAGDDESRMLAAQSEDERRAGRPEAARDFAEAALETESPHPAAHIAYVLALIDSGDLVTAHRALERAYVALGRWWHSSNTIIPKRLPRCSAWM